MLMKISPNNLKTGLIVIGVILLILLLNINNFRGSIPINNISPLSYATLNNELFGFGSNFGGQLGLSNLLKSPLEVQSIQTKDIVAYDAGNKHSIVLTSAGEVIQYGVNGIPGESNQRYIEYKEGEELKRLTNVVSISAGADYSLALLNDGSVWAWGSNLTAQLGQGNNEESIYAKKINQLKDITQISAGYKFGLALNKYGEVYAWGGSCEESKRQKAEEWLANPTTVIGVGGYYDPTSLGGNENNINNQSEDFNSYCANQEVIGFTSKVPIKIEGLNSITKISAGWGHTLAIDTNGEVWGVGCNLYSQVSNTPDHMKPYKIPGLKNIAEVSAGFRHSLALTKEGKVYSWGHNLRGSLGLKESSDKEVTPKLISVNNISSISAGHDFSVLTDTNNKLIIFGENNSGVITKDLNTIYTPNPTFIYKDKSFSSAVAGKSFVLALTNY